MIDESDHDHDNNDYNDAGNAIIDPPDDCSHNHDKFSPELDSRVPGPCCCCSKNEKATLKAFHES